MKNIYSGLGIKKSQLNNHAFFMKLGWLIITKPNDLWLLCQEKYPRSRIIVHFFIKLGGMILTKPNDLWFECYFVNIVRMILVI